MHFLSFFTAQVILTDCIKRHLFVHLLLTLEEKKAWRFDTSVDPTRVSLKEGLLRAFCCEISGRETVSKGEIVFQSLYPLNSSWYTKLV